MKNQSGWGQNSRHRTKPLGRRRATHRRAQPRTISASRRRRGFFEQLEERHLLATFTVATLGDTPFGSCQPNDCTLRDAIEAANANQGPDQITFDPVAFGTPQTINLKLGEFAITETVTIDGPGQDLLTIDAQQQSRIFNIVPGNIEGTFDVAMTGFRLTGGRTTGDNGIVNDRFASTHSGGAIRFSSRGMLTLTDSMVTGNLTEGIRADGGGIYAAGSITLNASTVSGNRTTGDSASGGGLSARGSLTATGSEIGDNHTTGATARGGGLATGGSVTLTDSTITENSTIGFLASGGGAGISGSATLTRSTISANHTAGEFARGGGIYANGLLALTDSTVSGNRTTGEYAAGGGLYTRSTVTLTNSTVSGNSTESLGALGYSARGGGLYARGLATLTNSTVSDNHTAGSAAHGGGVYSREAVHAGNSTIAGNRTTGSRADGGGIFSRGAVTLANSTVSGNRTTGNDAHGGGVYVSELADNGQLVITNSILAGNTVSSGTGPDFEPDSDGTVTASDSLIGDNSDTGLAAAPLGSPDLNGNLIGTSATRIDPLLGPLQDNGGPTETRALLANSPAIDAGDPNFNASQLPDDQRGAPLRRVVDGGSGSARLDIGAVERQSLVVDTTVDEDDDDYAIGDLSLREAIGLANGSLGLDTITFDAQVFDSAQVIDLALGELQVTEKLTIAGPGEDLLTIDAQRQSRIFNFAPDHTPGAFDATIDGLRLTGGRTTGDNRSVGDGETRYSGGGIRFNSRGRLTLTGSTISGNSTAGFLARGGGIFCKGSLTMRASTISGNSTAGLDAAAGGLYVRQFLTITDSTISENRTTGTSSPGGGLYVRGLATVTDSTIAGNSTAGLAAQGGGIFAGNFLTVTRSTISGNRTTGQNASGGGISGSVTLIESTVSDNSTAGTSASGGGIRGGTVTLTNSTISGNRTAGLFSHGGGLYSYGRISVTGSTISDNRTEIAANGGGLAFSTLAQNQELRLLNSILAGNTAQGDGPDLTTTGVTTLAVSHSLIGDNSSTPLSAAPVGSPDVNGNLIGTSAMRIQAQLEPLADHGGPTRIHALRAESPAIDAGDNTAAQDAGLVTDQRAAGFARIRVGGSGTATVDMGSYEFGLDFGDAPPPYPVTLAEDGPRHAHSDLFLGSLIDTEADGQPDADAGQGAAGGDDNVGDADEDGVSLAASIVASRSTAATSSYAVTASGSGKLDAWIDFNHDNVWDEPTERIFSSADIAAGVNLLSFTVPANATPGVTFARFRLSSAGGLGPQGSAPDGEVEDYRVTILDGDAGGVQAEIQPPTSGTLDVVVEGNQLVVRSGSVDLLRTQGTSLDRLHVTGQAGDDTLNVANLEAIFSGLVGGDAGGGLDRWRLTGSDHDLDLTRIADAAIQGLEVIDITGSGANRLTLDFHEVLNLSDTSDQLIVLSNLDDTVAIGDGWMVTGVTLEDDTFFRVLEQGGARLLLNGPANWQHPANRHDVNNDGLVTPVGDILPLINEVNQRRITASDGILPMQPVAPDLPAPYLDVNGDGRLTPVGDILVQINFINSQPEPEGEHGVWKIDFERSASGSPAGGWFVPLIQGAAASRAGRATHDIARRESPWRAAPWRSPEVEARQHFPRKVAHRNTFRPLGTPREVEVEHAVDDGSAEPLSSGWVPPRSVDEVFRHWQ